MKLYAALITLSLIWGMSFMFIKLLLPALGPWGVVFWRCFFGAVTLLVTITARKQFYYIKKLPWKSLMLVGIFNALIPWGLIAVSELRISSSMAATMNATTPIWTSLIGFLFFSVSLKAKHWTGIFVGFIGILFLLNFNVQSIFTEDFIGIGTMLGATICYGFASQYTRRYLKDVPVSIIAFFTLLFGMAGGFTLMLVTDGFSAEVFFSPKSFLSMIGLGVLGSGIAYLLFYYMIKEGSAEFASFVTYLVPVTALLWGSMLLNEELSSNLIVGLVLIFSGVYLSTRRTPKVRERESVQSL
ncbi:DMT family transporter [Pseudalkalibacillus caeni]|uniref:DMT family transporter n=1 Tax=Exobacillus caeni TaxID=2574798 RepID=A0A5R9F234_9BACL|nr:DMT family transporter [Pseudalkalibacillus caeni]TLS37702.1 DMT family transporter [Pseudalkalibacillus caeni]